MIKNFGQVKQQLEELAPVINSFKSDAVQLRIIELIFQGTGTLSDLEDEPTVLSGSDKVRRKKHGVRIKVKGDKADKQNSRSKSGRPGPGEMIDRLITDGFFKQARTIRDIIDHCNKKLAYSFKAQEFSVSLNRAVRNKKLTRNENKDGQYEYTKA